MSTDRSGFSKDVLELNPGLAEVIRTLPASKYRNARSEAKGLRFQSGREAAGVMDLVLQEEQHLIFGLRLQVRFPLPGKTVYVADAVYLYVELTPHVVDFKGIATREFKLKAKLFKERYGQDIELV